MKVPARIAGLILPLFFIIGIGVTAFTGYWQTESSKEPAKYSTGELSGEYNPADIRGSYSLEDIQNAFKIPVETLTKAFGLSDTKNPSAILVKEFETLFGTVEGKEIGTDSMRLFVALYLNRPYIPEDNTALPQPAFNILRREKKLSEEVLSSIESRVVSLENTETSPSSMASDDTEAHEDMIMEIKGKTLFSELLDWGLSKEQIETALGGIPMGQRSISVRDYCADKGIEFSTVKTSLQEMLEKLK